MRTVLKVYSFQASGLTPAEPY